MSSIKYLLKINDATIRRILATHIMLDKLTTYDENGHLQSRVSLKLGVQSSVVIVVLDKANIVYRG